MSLATRCAACGTVFRVVQDQLKVAEGWVRCGRCHEVFNALEGLFDIEPEPIAGQPPPQAASSAPETPRPDATSLTDAVPQPDAQAGGGDGAEGSSDTATLASDDTPASRVAARDRLDFADARFNNALLVQEGIVDEQIADSGLSAEPEADATAPEFLRLAERQERWARPRAVLTLASLCVLLLLALALQIGVHFRDLLAAVMPPLQPALQALCDLAGCRVEALRRIDDIVIESSALTNSPHGDAMRLAIVLRNRGPLLLAMPAVELTLTEPGGRLLARRALLPSEFGIADPTLPAASESALQLMLSTGGRPATGYTVEPFYP